MEPGDGIEDAAVLEECCYLAAQRFFYLDEQKHIIIHSQHAHVFGHDIP